MREGSTVKKPIVRSMAVASLAAGSMGTAQAAISTPTFNCLDGGNAGAGGTIGWPYSTVTGPTLTFDFADAADESSALDCQSGTFSEGVAARKAGKNQQEYLLVTMKEVFLSGFAPANTNHLKIGFDQVLGEIVDGVQTYDAYWDITGEYLLSNFEGGGTLVTNFIGIKLQTTQKFDGLSSLKYDYAQNTIVFSAELQEGAGVLSLTNAPRAVGEPGTLALLGTGLLGAVIGRRRGRKSW
jgi:hypothetical protein